MGIKDQMTDDEIKNLLRKRYLIENILPAKVLIVDEISMLRDYHLDLVNRICKTFRNNPLSFGGLQVILCGDFFQLPPVSKNGEKSEFVYTSGTWQEMDIKICYLHEQHRQEDKNFLQMLNEIRRNSVTETTKFHLHQRINSPINIDIPPTKLYTHNLDVDAINSCELGKIKGKSKAFPMTSSGAKALVEMLKKSCLAPEELIVKKGAVVMFVKNNFAKGYVNGTLGKVTGFDKESNYPIIETIKKEKIIAEPESWTVEEGERVIAEISQVPLRLAWAITVHKSQGMSLDAAVIDLSKAFEPGMGYVALSRVRKLAGIKLLGINETAYKVDEDIIQFNKELIRISQTEEDAFKSLSLKEIQKRQKQYLQSIGC